MMRKNRVMPIALTLLVGAAISALHASAQTPSQTQATVIGDPEAGADLFETVCSECHGAAATAPTLRGVIGRPIASVASFYGYSEALKQKSSLRWTVENLDTFLKSPADFAPGVLMYRTFPDAKNRADIIAFLATLPPPRND